MGGCARTVWHNVGPPCRVKDAQHRPRVPKSWGGVRVPGWRRGCKCPRHEHLSSARSLASRSVLCMCPYGAGERPCRLRQHSLRRCYDGPTKGVHTRMFSSRIPAPPRANHGGRRALRGQSMWRRSLRFSICVKRAEPGAPLSRSGGTFGGKSKRHVWILCIGKNTLDTRKGGQRFLTDLDGVGPDGETRRCRNELRRES